MPRLDLEFPVSAKMKVHKEKNEGIGGIQRESMDYKESCQTVGEQRLKADEKQDQSI